MPVVPRLPQRCQQAQSTAAVCHGGSHACSHHHAPAQCLLMSQALCRGCSGGSCRHMSPCQALDPHKPLSQPKQPQAQWTHPAWPIRLPPHPPKTAVASPVPLPSQALLVHARSSCHRATVEWEGHCPRRPGWRYYLPTSPRAEPGRLRVLLRAGTEGPAQAGPRQQSPLHPAVPP